MGDLKHNRRYRTNPVEIAIFAVVALVFGNSIYKLFYDSRNFQPTALKPMTANPVSESGRAPASITPAFLNLEFKCDNSSEGPTIPAKEQETAASKIRLTGPLCGVDGSAGGSQLTKTVVVNQANKFSATVFTDVNAAKFSTDYVPLNPGKNTIHVEFSYRGGKTVSQDLQINKL